MIPIQPAFVPDNVLHFQVQEIKRAIEVELILGYPIPPHKLAELLKVIEKLEFYTGNLEGLIMDGLDEHFKVQENFVKKVGEPSGET